MKTKPFNLEEALNGAKVVTRHGHEVKQLTCFDTSNNHNYPLYGVIGKDICCWARTGQFNIEINNHCNDLFLAVEPQRKWLNLYKDERGNFYLSQWCHSLKEAKNLIDLSLNFIKTIEITDEL
jgi:hypothetical protein